MPYNAFIATHKFGRKTADVDAATAGVAKVPSGGGKSRGELKALGTRMNWDATRELSYQDIQRMGSDEMLFQETFNPSFQKALETRDNFAHNRAAEKQSAVKRMWGGGASEAESQKAFEAGDLFASNHAQFIRSQTNGLTIAAFMAENNLDATDMQSYVAAFKALVPLGKLVLSPKAAGIGTEETITGDELRGYAQLHELLEPHRVPTAEEQMSAADYYKSHPELHTKRIPHLVLEGFDRAERTFKSNHPEYIATKDARDKLLAQLQEWKMVISPQSLEAAWKHLVEKGELEIDKNKVVQGQAVRITDLGGQR